MSVCEGEVKAEPEGETFALTVVSASGFDVVTREH